MTHLHQRVIDLFAGPGGWSEGLKALGYTELGIEWDDAACKTAKAAGHARLKADVAELNPGEFGPFVDGLIASPPCQAFSAAGDRKGADDLEQVIACALELAAGNDTRAERIKNCSDARSLLVAEPIRWANALRPEWIALEQVPPVLELWTLYAQILEGWGYRTWTGVLCAADFGVPQTRRRAILMARRALPVQPPAPTHSQSGGMTLLGELKPWVTMAAALGWDEAVFVQRERSGDRAEEGFDPHEIPAQALTSKTRSWAIRPGEMQVRTTFGEPHRGKAVGSPKPEFDPAAQPSRTIVSKTGDWALTRPATTVCADPRIPKPGWRGNPDDYADGNPTRSGDDAIRVTPQEALILQSFRPDYPVHGSRSKQFEQIGNAVPPLLAQAVLAELVEPIPMEAAA